ncbi:MAG: PAS domain S-box protein, partial [Desulfobacterales bacterium]|nr:PAS domain S-box protein [Desulfobacterales bacterium]
MAQYESYAYRKAQADIVKHGWVISDALWNFNRQGAFEYLVLASETSNYQRLAVKDTQGAIFQEVFGKNPAGSQRLFLTLKLITAVPLEAKIVHAGKTIGRIEAIWYCHTIYLEIYILLALSTVWIIFFLVARLVNSKSMLEERVRTRTGELHALNRSLQVEVDEHRRAKADLRRSEEKFRAMFEQTVVGVSLCDAHSGEFIQTNQRYCDIFGYTFEELRRLSFQKLTHPADLQGDLEKMALLLEGKIRHFKLEKRYLHKDGSTIWGRITVAAMWEHGAEPEYHLAFLEDVTQSKKAEAALKESEKKLARSKKMESLGLLAGGVAHDLNNILSGIVSYPELLLLDLPEDSQLKKPIETIRESGSRAAAIVQDLLTVARGVAITRENVNP